MGIYIKFWHFFTMPTLQIWPCHVTQEANFEKILFFPNCTFNIRKSYKISSRNAVYFRSYQPKTSRGGRVENTPHSAFRVNKVNAFEPVPFSADRQQEFYLLSVTVSFYSI